MPRPCRSRAARFTQKADRIVLSLTAAEAADLPEVE
jgi:hypothetical protein